MPLIISKKIAKVIMSNQVFLDSMSEIFHMTDYIIYKTFYYMACKITITLINK